MFFWDYFGRIGPGPKNENQISQTNFIMLKNKAGTSNYVFMLHMTHILIFISYFDTTNFFLAKFDKNGVFNNWGPVENAFLGSCHCFQEIFFFAKQICRAKKKLPVNSFK